MEKKYQICVRCVMDTTDPEIEFNEQGVCSHCLGFGKKLQAMPVHSGEKEMKKQDLIARIKENGKGKKYDCIIGVSGGVDSTYVAWLAAQEGLRCLAVHLDNGWNSELAVGNIEKTLKNCGFDLYTHVINWKEFKDLQRAYLKASVIDIEALSDHAIIAILYHLAAKYNIKYILSGSNTVTEGILPSTWAYNKQDEQNIKDIHKRYGKVKLKTYPFLSQWKSIWYREVKKIQIVNFLDYYEYNKDMAKETIKKSLGWVDYGGKHFESVFTRFYQAYILPKKFHVDKRRAHLSTLINSGQMTREEALDILARPPYDPKLLQEDLDFVIKKLDFSREEFENIMANAPQSHYSFRYQLPFSLRYPVLATALRKFV